MGDVRIFRINEKKNRVAMEVNRTLLQTVRILHELAALLPHEPGAGTDGWETYQVLYAVPSTAMSGLAL